MSDSTHLMTWVTRDTKARFAALAHAQGITESAFLKRLVDASLVPTTQSKPQAPDLVEPVRATGRVSIHNLREGELLGRPLTGKGRSHRQERLEVGSILRSTMNSA